MDTRNPKHGSLPKEIRGRRSYQPQIQDTEQKVDEGKQPPPKRPSVNQNWQHCWKEAAFALRAIFVPRSLAFHQDT